jgi:Bifunctional DNA primase/polymerase, N-terminal/AAA domain/Primase C terminal 1 (PriCT-1)
MYSPKNNSNQLNQIRKTELITALSSLPPQWQLTPVGSNKAPYRKAWQSETLERSAIATEIKSGRAKGYGLLTGTKCGGILAIDADGEAAHELLARHGELPPTVAFTSGKPGRCQYLFRVEQEYWDIIKTTKLNTGVKGDDGKDQLLELRWDGCQSVLPPSVHPQTGRYQWVNSPDSVEIAECPIWVIDLMLNSEAPHNRELIPDSEAPRNRELTPNGEAPRNRVLTSNSEAPRNRELIPDSEAPRNRELSNRELIPDSEAPRNRELSNRELIPDSEAPHNRKLTPNNEAPHNRELTPNNEASHNRELTPNRELIPDSEVARNRELTPNNKAPRNRELTSNRELIPDSEAPHNRELTPNSKEQPESASARYKKITVPVPACIPLKECLAKKSRSLLNGVSEGGRNDAAAKLARDLIGTANYLQASCQAFDGDPRQMLEDFAQRCNPPLPEREVETIWKSAQGSSATPACTPEGVENCVRGWYWNNCVTPNVGSDSIKPVSHEAAKPKMGLQEAANKAREILASGMSELSVNIELEQVRQRTGMGDYSWEHKIIKPLRKSMDAERFKLELLGLLQMEDAVERCRQIALLAPKYSMGAGTIKEAMAAMKQRTQAPKAEVLALDDLFSSETEAMDWVVPGLLPVGETVLLCALPKAGKSKLAVDLSFCVATGESRFLGQETKHGKVLLIAPDASKQSLKHELARRGFRISDKNLHIIPRWSIDQMAVLEAELENFRPDLVVIDSLKKITAGKEISENSAEFADNIIALNDMLTRYRAAGILVHHANKGADAIGVERARGSTAIVGACWGVWMLDRIPKPDPNNAKRMIVDPKDPKRILTATSRDSEGTTLNIEFNAENNSWEFMGEVGIEEPEARQQQSHRERIMNVLLANPKELSGPEIMELLGVTREQRGTIYSELGRMENKRLISSKPAPGDKRYNLYSLPKFNQSGVTDTVTVDRKKSLPPPPPTLSVSVAEHCSENHIQQGLDNSQQNSQQVVSPKIECDSSQNAELPTNNGIDSIVSREAVSQGGGGVKPILEPSSVTVLTHELTQELEPQHQVAETGAGEIETGVGEIETGVGEIETGVGEIETGVGEIETGVGEIETDAGEIEIGAGEIETDAGEIETDAGEQSTLAHDYARRIEAAIGFNSPAVSACINIDLCEDIAANKIIEALVVSIVSDERYQVFKSLVAKQTLIASTVEPATELGLNEAEVELVEFAQLAIADNDSAFVKDVQSVIKEVCDSGAADREKVWGALTRASQATFTALLKSQPESEPFAQEQPHAPSEPQPQALSEPRAEEEPQTPSEPRALKESEPEQPAAKPIAQEPEQAPLIDPSDAELIRDIASIWWEQFGEISPSHRININLMVSKYSVAWIAQWLTTESEHLVRDRISDLLRRVNRPD